MDETIDTSDVRARFRARLVRRRQEAGLTQVGLSRAIHTNSSHISRIEAGERMPSLDRIIEIAQVLNTDVADLMPTVVEPADIEAMQRQRMGAYGAIRERPPLTTRLAFGQGRRCCYPFEPCTCSGEARVWRGATEPPAVTGH